MSEWWQSFFDADYLRLWEGSEAAGTSDRQVAGLQAILDLPQGARVLDAPCGYGRIAQLLAEKGAAVLGIDYSADMLAEAESRRGSIPPERLRYVEHDLRLPLAESGFDAALNLFSSLGYGTEEDDLAMRSNMRSAVRAGGLVFIETNHRDRTVAGIVQGQALAERLPDGTLLLQQSRFNPVAGRAETTWYWHGPADTARSVRRSASTPQSW